MAAVTDVPVGTLSYQRFKDVLAPEVWERVSKVADQSAETFEGRRIWNVNSTARGGGVAEMLVSLLAYAKGAGVDARWAVIQGNAPFFGLTKRIHNRLHGAEGDGGALGEAEHEIYRDALAPNIEEFSKLVEPKDVVIVHDPQPAGLIGPLKEMGVPVIWRCHVGIDLANDRSREAWNFLIPYVSPADAYVFSREAFAWEGLDESKIKLIAPSIDAFAAKNQELEPEIVAAILRVAGLGDTGDDEGAAPEFQRFDGKQARVTSRAQAFEGRPLRPDDPVVLQVSRWDRLKDPLGVIDGFLEHVLPQTDAHLVYAGPAVEAVSDDPEGAEVLKEAQDRFESLSPEEKERVHLVALPMDDLEENAAIVNALQRRATVVVQKSLAEGFGLTVAEAMWKGRPVVASRIGGIQDQIEDGKSGVLLDDPTDLAAYGAAVRGLIEDPSKAEAIGREAQSRVREDFLGVRSLLQYLELIQPLLK
ncbi:MAG: trehalose synthase [Solirubrobacteraceae bacterium]|nr:trehalose synthase [Solirubrobacteraceae bacterium]